MRYHPAVVAQKAATVQILSGDRFMLGLGAGENLNEHVIGRGWPPVNMRHDMLDEAIRIIAALFGSGYVNFAGKHFRVDSAMLWDLPQTRVPIATAVSGAQSVHRFAPLSDHMVAVQPERELCASWDHVTQRPDSRKLGQVPICWDPDRQAAVHRAHEQFRWFGGGWKINAELPGTAAFAAASQFVRADDVAESIPCGPDVTPIVDAVAAFVLAGFTDVALVQIGGEHQQEFFPFARKELLPALREAWTS
jgi:G6PDH family F420-dependent oxidoreductase